MGHEEMYEVYDGLYRYLITKARQAALILGIVLGMSALLQAEPVRIVATQALR